MAREDSLFPGEDDDFELPNPREVNKRIKAEAQAAKREAKKVLTGEGVFYADLRLAQKNYPGDPRKQLAVVLGGKSVPAAIGRRRTVSDKRYRDLKAGMHRFLTLLPKVRAPIRNLGDFGRAQFLALVGFWETKGIGEGTAQQNFCVIRRFFRLVGKPDVVPTGNELIELLRSHGLTLGTAGRDKIPDMSKAWEARGVDPQEIIDRLRADGHEVVACQVEMQWRFGLRDNEVIQLEPEKDHRDGFLMADNGTKGGKPRAVPFFSDPEKARLQHEALDRAKQLARKHPRGKLSIKGLRRDQAYNHFLKTVSKYGITKKGLGVTLHGLRHQYGSDLFLDVTGLPAPVLNLLPAEEYRRQREKVLKGFQAVSEAKGHGRLDISTSYLGSPTKLGKAQIQRITKLLGQLSPASRALVQAGAKEAWMTGPAGRGSPMSEAEPLHLAVRFHEEHTNGAFSELQARLEQIRLAAAKATGRPVLVVIWLDPGMPDEATEILFPFGVERRGQGPVDQ